MYYTSTLRLMLKRNNCEIECAINNNYKQYKLRILYLSGFSSKTKLEFKNIKRNYR